MNKVQEIQDELQRIEQRRVELKTKLRQVIKDTAAETINDVVKTRNIKFISKSPRMFIVKFSDVMGNPLTPIFYDWEKQAETILEHLKEKVKLENWIDFLKKLLESRKGNVIYFSQKITVCGITYNNPIPLSAEFIEKVVKKLEEC